MIYITTTDDYLQHVNICATSYDTEYKIIKNNN